MGLLKLRNAMDGSFFEGLNFTNEQHPQNSQNLRTSKKTNYMVYTFNGLNLNSQSQISHFYGYNEEDFLLLTVFHA